MKSKIVMIAAFALVLGQSARADGIQSCGNLFFWVADECLYQNDLKLKAADKNEVGRLKKRVGILERRLAALEAKVAAIHAPDLSGYAKKEDIQEVVRYGQAIQLRSKQNFSGPGKCIDQRTNPDPVSRADRVSAADCTSEPIQRWDVAR